MFIINPDPYSLPCYRIGPFATKDITVNNTLPESNTIDQYFSKRFNNKKFIYTENGRKAINLALSFYNLQSDDIVTILTTTNNFYISGCVTKEIEKNCKWSREIEEKTKLIFVNHEFGYPFPYLEGLKKYKLPIIEDCAFSFFSEDKNKTIGSVGDFVIYSFTKIFPIQIGGLLVCKNNFELNDTNKLDDQLLHYIKKVLSHSLKYRNKIIETRIHNYTKLKMKFGQLDINEHLPLQDGIVPGVFMFSTRHRKIDLPALKIHYYNHGIQCSVFYGEEAFYIPVHQGLTDTDLDYFYEVMNSFLKKNN